jgi:hypothetical protein
MMTTPRSWTSAASLHSSIRICAAFDDNVIRAPLSQAACRA